MNGFPSRGEGRGDKTGIGGELSRGGESVDGVDFQSDGGSKDSADPGDSYQELDSPVLTEEPGEILLRGADQGADLFQQRQAFREDFPVNPFQVQLTQIGASSFAE